jgi:hypothetical protein
MSTIKVDNLDTRTGTGNITLNRPLVGDGSGLTGIAPTKATVEALGIELPAANLTGTIHADRYTDTVYTHPTTAGNKHIPTGGATDQVLTYSSSGTASWATSASKVQMVTGTFDGSLSSNLAITGAGFTPAGYIIHASNTSGVGDVSFGMMGGTTQGSVRHVELGTASAKWAIDITWIMYLVWGGGDVRCQHFSFDVDGITIRRVPLSSPVGDVRYNILFFG